MKAKITNFMLANWKDHLDDANCLNMTALAEDALEQFGEHYGDELEQEEYFELAFQVSEKLRNQGLINQ